MRVWIELPLAYPEVVDAYVRRIPGVVRASTVNDADAAIFIIDSPLTPALRAVSDYVLTQPRFKDHVLAIAVGPIDAVPWIFRKLEFYDARDVGAAEVGAHVMRWLWAVATASSALARAVDATVPYVQATLAPHSSVTTSHPDWIAVHAGRARSSIAQLEGLRKLTQAAPPAVGVGGDVDTPTNPRADLPPGQRRTQVARRKQATRRQG